MEEIEEAALEAAEDDEATNKEKERLHEINSDWFDVNCDDACRTAGVPDCIEKNVNNLS